MVLKVKKKIMKNINLADERTFFMDSFVDDCVTGNGRLNMDSDDFGSSCKSHDFRLFDKMPPCIGDRLGGGKIFK